jgi:hypothetical protein
VKGYWIYALKLRIFQIPLFILLLYLFFLIFQESLLLNLIGLTGIVVVFFLLLFLILKPFKKLKEVVKVEESLKRKYPEKYKQESRVLLIILLVFIIFNIVFFFFVYPNFNLPPLAWKIIYGIAVMLIVGLGYLFFLFSEEKSK